MRGRAGRITRTYAYRLFTRMDEDRIDAIRRGEAWRPAHALAQRLLRGGTVVVAEGPAAGLLLSTDHLDLTHVQAFGMVRGVLEPAVQEALRRTIAAGATVYDVGANVGFFTLFAARLAGPAGRVEAFEPAPANAAALRRNVELNGFAHARVHEVAVGAAAGSGRLLQVDEESWSHLDDRGWHPRTKQVLEVAVIALDDEVESGRLQVPDVVKLDVEGSELDVLRGMRRTLETAAPVVICELHETGGEFAELMRDLGYDVENLDGPGPVAAAGYALARRRPAGP